MVRDLADARVDRRRHRNFTHDNEQKHDSNRERGARLGKPELQQQNRKWPDALPEAEILGSSSDLHVWSIVCAYFSRIQSLAQDWDSTYGGDTLSQYGICGGTRS
jgi:hypothetical protein